MAKEGSSGGISVPVFGTTVGLAVCFTVLLTSSNIFPFSNSPLRRDTQKEPLVENARLQQSSRRKSCSQTCSVEIVESIPENVTFGENAFIPKTTYEAWKQLILSSKRELHIAAYKSSLRAKHVGVDGHNPSTAWGDEIFELLLQTGQERHVNIRMIENYPSKDPGDNEDGKSLARRGVVDRRQLHFSKVFGAGLMHSKFLIADDEHFYLGSANLDWRSLNQKMELGVLVLNCPCLGSDLRNIFDSYWHLTNLHNHTDNTRDLPANQFLDSARSPPTDINKDNPLIMSYGGVPMSVYLAASPKRLNGRGRTYDLDAIISVIQNARKFIYIHVMDYIPMLVYREPKKYWSIIDDALREAIVERGVELKLISAALHFVPENLHFLKSLQSLDGVLSNGSVEIKIFKIPIVTELQTQIARDRRTHNKFMVTEDSVVIGTSNWSGDYFSGTTGVQIVARQNYTGSRPFVEKMREIFVRDWLSPYAHSLSTYITLCLNQDRGGGMCEPIRHY